MLANKLTLNISKSNVIVINSNSKNNNLTTDVISNKIIICSKCKILRSIQSFACTWLHKGNRNEFLKHPKIKWLAGGFETPTSGLPVHCSTILANLTNFRMLLIA